MARGVQLVLRDTLGNASLQLCEVVAQLEAASERIAELEAKLASLKPKDLKPEVE